MDFCGRLKTSHLRQRTTWTAIGAHLQPGLLQFDFLPFDGQPFNLKLLCLTLHLQFFALSDGCKLMFALSDGCKLIDVFLSVLSLIKMVTNLGWSLVTYGSMPFWLPFPFFVIRIWVVILCRLPVQLQERLCWLFAQQVLPVRSNFEHSKSITCEHFTSFSVFQIFTLHPVGIPAVYSTGIPAVSKWYVHSPSNALLCHFQIIR